MRQPYREAQEALIQASRRGNHTGKQKGQSYREAHEALIQASRRGTHTHTAKQKGLGQKRVRMAVLRTIPMCGRSRRST